MSVHVRRRWLALCWHPRHLRRLLRYGNGVDVYCSRCHLKLVTVWEDASC